VLEVALELWLALTASPQARMVRQGKSMASAMLQVRWRCWFEKAKTLLVPLF
jgi:hypothetical protein